jgi:hypothetical protein
MCMTWLNMHGQYSGRLEVGIVYKQKYLSTMINFRYSQIIHAILEKIILSGQASIHPKIYRPNIFLGCKYNLEL